MAILLRSLLLLVPSLLALGAFATSGEVQVNNPWVQEAPPNAKVLAAYLEINNSSAKTQVITAVSSAAFDRVEIHRTIVDRNMARMELLKELTILPYTAIYLKPGGVHFMLIGARKRVQAGDSVPISLTLKGGSTVMVSAKVRAAKPEESPADHAKHGNHAH